MNSSTFEEKNEIRRTCENTEVKEVENVSNLVKSSVLGNKKINSENEIRETCENTELKQVNDSSNSIELDVLEFLNSNYKKGDVIKKFKDDFSLSEYEYKKIRNNLINQKVIKTENKRMIFKGSKILKIGANQK